MDEKDPLFSININMEKEDKIKEKKEVKDKNNEQKEIENKRISRR